jgi:hypothetical protein
MSDLFEKVTGAQDIFKKLASKIPGFGGYVERQNRRAADKILRETSPAAMRICTPAPRACKATSSAVA